LLLPVSSVVDQSVISNKNKIMRFLVAGVSNTIFGLAVYSICISIGIEVWIALLISMLFGIAFNFFTIAGYTFRELSPANLQRFIMSYLILYGINLILISLISLWVNNKILSQAIVTIPLAFLSYFLMNKYVFGSTAKNLN